MDFIGSALEQLKVTAASAGQLETSAPWQVEGGGGLPAAYFFLRGQGELVTEAQGTHHLEAGDLVFVTCGDTHCLRNGMGREPAGESHFLHVTVRAGIRADCPFVSALPPLLILSAGERASRPYLDSHLQSLVWESSHGGPASELMMARLWEVVFLAAFRTYLVQDAPCATGWLAAIRDPQMARVLGAIQQRPEAPWTVASLAAEAAMSRATLIRQFVRVMGEPPMTFLFRHRMGIAASLLQQGERSLAAVAAHVGYGSEAAFSNAFHRRYGSAPGAYRTANARLSANV